MFLTQTQINKLREKVANNMSTDIKLGKSQTNKLIKEGGALGSILATFLRKLIKPGISLGKNILAPLGLSATMSAADAAIQKKMYGSGTKTVKFSNKDLNDMTKIVKAFEDPDVLMKVVTKSLKKDINIGGALPLIPMLLGTLGAPFLTGRGLYRAGNQGQGLFRAGQRIKKKSLTPFHPLTNFEITEYFKDKKRFNGIYSRNNLLKLKKGAYVINLDHIKNTGTHWVVIFVQEDEVIYFDSFGVEYIPKEIMEKIEHSSLGNKNIKTSIFRIQDNISIMRGCFCILFIEYMLNNKTLTDFTNLFSPWNFEKNDDIIKRYFQ